MIQVVEPITTINPKSLSPNRTRSRISRLKPVDCCSPSVDCCSFWTCTSRLTGIISRLLNSLDTYQSTGLQHQSTDACTKPAQHLILGSNACTNISNTCSLLHCT